MPQDGSKMSYPPGGLDENGIRTKNKQGEARSERKREAIAQIPISVSEKNELPPRGSATNLRWQVFSNSRGRWRRRAIARNEKESIAPEGLCVSACGICRCFPSKPLEEDRPFYSINRESLQDSDAEKRKRLKTMPACMERRPAKAYATSPRERCDLAPKNARWHSGRHLHDDRSGHCGRWLLVHDQHTLRMHGASVAETFTRCPRSLFANSVDRCQRSRRMW